MTPARLSCGTDIDDLIAQVADGRAAEQTRHQATCPHCQAALAEYQRLWSPIDELSAQPVPVPDSILENALRKIRAAAAEPGFGVLVTSLGATRIANRVVAITARIATEQVAGVRAALSEQTSSTDPAVGTQGASTALQITLAASYGEDLIALAARIRHAVTERIRTLTGLEPVEITIIIDDVLAQPV
jgi:uncharacterized alkaline shock family protein YloU